MTTRIFEATRKAVPLRTKKNNRRSFSAVFEVVDAEKPKWRIRSSGVRGWPTNAELTFHVVSALKANDIEVKERSMGSPANCDSYHIDCAFLDGGLTAMTGNYWYAYRGAFITGRQVALFLADILDLRLDDRTKSVLG